MKQEISDEKIIADFEKWAEQFKNPEQEIFPYDDKEYTIQEILIALRTKSELGKDIIKNYRGLSENLGMEALVLLQMLSSSGGN